MLGSTIKSKSSYASRVSLHKPTTRDRDQDALTFSAQGLPSGATFTPQVQYGQAVLSWTPTAAGVGVYDISIEVTDSGLGPQDSGYIIESDAAVWSTTMS